MPAWAWVLTILLSFAGLLAVVLASARLRYRFEAEGVWTGRVDASRAQASAHLEFRFPGVRRTWELPQPATAEEPTQGDQGRQPSQSDQRDRPEQAPARHETPAPEERARPAPPPPTAKQPQVEPPETQPADHPAPEPSSGPEAIAPTLPPGMSRSERRMRTLFLLATDGDVWAWTRDYGMRAAVLTFRLLDPRVEAAVGHPDPALLGRTAGKWHAIRPLLPTDRAELGFRFQDRHPSFAVHLDGGFSVLTLALFGVRLAWAFPTFKLGRRTWKHWRNPRLTGWRAKVYTRVHEHA